MKKNIFIAIMLFGFNARMVIAQTATIGGGDASSASISIGCETCECGDPGCFSGDLGSTGDDCDGDLTSNVITLTNATCHGGANGTATVSTSGGTAPFHYLWNNGSTTSAIANLLAGTYTFTVTDYHICTSTSVVSINEPASSPVTVTVTPPASSICTGGSITLTAATTTVSYCAPGYTAGTGFGDFITGVHLGTINSNTGPLPPPYYQYYNASNTILMANSGNTINGSVNNNGFPQVVSVWIDYNQNGVFDLTEKLGERTGNSFSISFNVPPNAYNGQTRMRVINVRNTTNLLACGTYQFGDAQDFNVTITGGVNNSTIFSWSPSTFLNSTSGDIVTASNMTATTTYNVVATNAAGCGGASAVVTVNDLAPSVIIQASAHSVCAGVNVSFFANAINGGSSPVYNWLVNSISVQQTNSPVYFTTSLADDDQVQCIVTSNANCSSTPTTSSNIISMTVNPVVTPAITIADDPVCVGENVTFTSDINHGGDSPSFQWQLNGFNVGTNNPVYSSRTFSNNDQVKCILTSNAGCISSSTANSNIFTMTVNPLVTPSVTIVASATSVCGGTVVTFTATPVNGGSNPSYQWITNGVNAGANSNIFSTTWQTDNTPFYDWTTSVRMTSDQRCYTSPTATSNAVTVRVNNCDATLNLKLFIQGYLIGNGQMQAVMSKEGVSGATTSQVDTIFVELHSVSNPAVIVNTKAAVLMTNGTATAAFTNGPYAGSSYWIAVRHRNTITTWSASPVQFTTTTLYDYETSPASAYFSNEVVTDPFLDWNDSSCSFYSGDINQDTNVDLLDFTPLDSGINDGLYGYHTTDLNGDGNVDLIDFPVLQFGIVNGISSKHP